MNPEASGAGSKDLITDHSFKPMPCLLTAVSCRCVEVLEEVESIAALHARVFIAKQPEAKSIGDSC